MTKPITNVLGCNFLGAGDRCAVDVFVGWGGGGRGVRAHLLLSITQVILKTGAQRKRAVQSIDEI